jgi:hypothetical protein
MRINWTELLEPDALGITAGLNCLLRNRHLVGQKPRCPNANLSMYITLYYMANRADSDAVSVTLSWYFSYCEMR